MATPSRTLARGIPWTEEPSGLQVHGIAKSQTRLSDFTFPFHFHALEKEMATHSSVLAWRIPGTGEPGGPAVCGVAQSRRRRKRLSRSSSKFKQRFPSALSQISSLIRKQMSQEFSAVNWEAESHLHAGTWPTALGWKCFQVPRCEVRLERIIS